MIDKNCIFGRRRARDTTGSTLREKADGLTNDGRQEGTRKKRVVYRITKYSLQDVPMASSDRQHIQEGTARRREYYFKTKGPFQDPSIASLNRDDEFVRRTHELGTSKASPSKYEIAHTTPAWGSFSGTTSSASIDDENKHLEDKSPFAVDDDVDNLDIDFDAPDYTGSAPMDVETAGEHEYDDISSADAATAVGKHVARDTLKPSEGTDLSAVTMVTMDRDRFDALTHVMSAKKPTDGNDPVDGLTSVVTSTPNAAVTNEPKSIKYSGDRDLTSMIVTPKSKSGEKDSAVTNVAKPSYTEVIPVELTSTATVKPGLAVTGKHSLGDEDVEISSAIFTPKFDSKKIQIDVSKPGDDGSAATQKIDHHPTVASAFVECKKPGDVSIGSKPVSAPHHNKYVDSTNSRHSADDETMGQTQAVVDRNVDDDEENSGIVYSDGDNDDYDDYDEDWEESFHSMNSE